MTGGCGICPWCKSEIMKFDYYRFCTSVQCTNSHGSREYLRRSMRLNQSLSCRKEDRRSDRFSRFSWQIFYSEIMKRKSENRTSVFRSRTYSSRDVTRTVIRCDDTNTSHRSGCTISHGSTFAFRDETVDLLPRAGYIQ